VARGDGCRKPKPPGKSTVSREPARREKFCGRVEVFRIVPVMFIVWLARIFTDSSVPRAGLNCGKQKVWLQSVVVSGKTSTKAVTTVCDREDITMAWAAFAPSSNPAPASRSIGLHLVLKFMAQS